MAKDASTGLMVLNVVGGGCVAVGGVFGLIQNVDLRNVIVAVYAVSLAIPFLMVQFTNVAWVSKLFGFMYNWYGRAAFLIFLGFLVIDGDSTITIILGVVAVILGIFEACFVFWAKLSADSTTKASTTTGAA